MAEAELLQNWHWEVDTIALDLHAHGRSQLILQSMKKMEFDK